MDVYINLFLMIPMDHDILTYEMLFEAAAENGRHEIAGELYKLTKIDDNVFDKIIANVMRTKKLHTFKWLCMLHGHNMTYEQFNKCYMWAVKWKYLDIITILTEKNKRYVTEKFRLTAYNAAMRRHHYCTTPSAHHNNKLIIDYLDKIKVIIE